jgi:hypothetical protein
MVLSVKKVKKDLKKIGRYNVGNNEGDLLGLYVVRKRTFTKMKNGFFLQFTVKNCWILVIN